MPEFTVKHTQTTEIVEEVTYSIVAESLEKAQEISDNMQIDTDEPNEVTVINRSSESKATDYETSDVLAKVNS